MLGLSVFLSSWRLKGFSVLFFLEKFPRLFKKISTKNSKIIFWKLLKFQDEAVNLFQGKLKTKQTFLLLKFQQFKFQCSLYFNVKYELFQMFYHPHSLAVWWLQTVNQSSLPIVLSKSPNYNYMAANFTAVRFVVKTLIKTWQSRYFFYQRIVQ